MYAPAHPANRIAQRVAPALLLLLCRAARRVESALPGCRTGLSEIEEIAAERGNRRGMSSERTRRFQPREHRRGPERDVPAIINYNSADTLKPRLSKRARARALRSRCDRTITITQCDISRRERGRNVGEKCADSRGSIKRQASVANSVAG